MKRKTVTRSCWGEDAWVVSVVNSEWRMAPALGTCPGAEMSSGNPH